MLNQLLLTLLFLIKNTYSQVSTPTASSLFIENTYDLPYLTTSSSGSCIKASCSTSDATPCFNLDRSAGTVVMNDISCIDGEVCSINNLDYSATCAPSTFFTKAEELYPGQKCVQFSTLAACYYGLQICDVTGTCIGQGRGEICASTADCNPSLYCFQGICTDTLTKGSACTYDNQCGRVSMCKYDSPTSIYGTCMPLFTIPDGGVLDGKLIYVNSSSANGFSLPQSSLAPLLCESGYADSKGICGQGLRSIQKGQKCNTDSDCPASDGLTSAKCKCGFNSNGTKYCDILPGDSEWVQTRAAVIEFRTYADSTSSCNIAARWKFCDQPALYFAWKCLEARAKYYVYLIGNSNLGCLSGSLKDKLPVFSEVAYWCQNINSEGNLVLRLGMLIMFVLLAFFF